MEISVSKSLIRKRKVEVFQEEEVAGGTSRKWATKSLRLSIQKQSGGGPESFMCRIEILERL